MKKKLFIGMIAILFSCKTKMEITNQNINKKWMLVQFENFQKEELIEKKCFLDLTNKSSASAKMGCNSLGFQYEVLATKTITFSQGFSTKMFCIENKVEDAFLNSIREIESYEINGQKLILKNKTNKEMVFIAEEAD